jgi:hypothetical protein
MFRKWGWAALVAAALSLGQFAFAQAQEPTPEAAAAQLKSFIAALKFRSGDVAVPEAEAKFHLGDQFRYLEKADANRVLEQLWGNPPDRPCWA